MDLHLKVALQHLRARGLPDGWTEDSVKKFWKTLTGDVEHKVTKCIKKMDGNVDDPGAFCAGMRDRVEGKGWRSEERAAALKLARTFLALQRTTRDLVKLLQQLNIPGEVRGRGRSWEVELPDEASYKLFNRKVWKDFEFDAYRTGYGAWVLRAPKTKHVNDDLDYNNPASPHHY